MRRFIKQFTVTSCLGAALFTVMGCEHYRGCVDSCWPKSQNSMVPDRVRDMQDARTDYGHKLEQTVWNSYFTKDERTNESTTTLNETGKEFLRHLARRQPSPDPQIWLQYPSDVTDSSKHEQIIAERRIAIRNFLTKETHMGAGEKYQIAVLDPVERTNTVAGTEKPKKAIDIRSKLTVDQSEDASVGNVGGIRGKSTVKQREDAGADSGGGIRGKLAVEQRADSSAGSRDDIRDNVILEQRTDASVGSGGGIQGKLTLEQRADASGSSDGIRSKLSPEQPEDVSGGHIRGNVPVEQPQDAGAGSAGGAVGRNSVRNMATDSSAASQRRTIAR